jgi:ubiquinone/menaquinone biosynthesis C-methylase UbiE
MTTAQQTSNREDPAYWLTRDAAETRRLIQQARFLNSFTGWILREAGIAEGMKVLDVGSGAGDVALLAAALVGSHGTVVGVDANPEVLAVARARARSAGLTNVEFVEGDCRSVELGDGFDAVVGRLVLLYMSDPTETLRSLLEHLAPGGIVAFQEINTTVETLRSWPPLPIWQTAIGWIRAAARQAGLNTEMGYELRRIFLEAGLPAPSMQLDSQVGGGPDWEGYDYIAATVRSVLPVVLESGIATAEEVGIDTLADRMCAATVASGGVVKAPDLVSAWTRKP